MYKTLIVFWQYGSDFTEVVSVCRIFPASLQQTQNFIKQEADCSLIISSVRRSWPALPHPQRILARLATWFVPRAAAGPSSVGYLWTVSDSHVFSRGASTEVSCLPRYSSAAFSNITNIVVLGSIYWTSRIQSTRAPLSSSCLIYHFLLHTSSFSSPCPSQTSLSYAAISPKRLILQAIPSFRHWHRTFLDGMCSSTAPPGKME